MSNILYKKVFVMTLPRSGSTLLGLILGGHNKIFHMGESMYCELLNPHNTICSCGKIDCEFLNKIYAQIHKKHLARPLLKAWQITDKKYWPNKKIYSDSIIQNPNKKINNDSLNYWIKRCKSSLENIINAYKKYSKKEIYIDNSKLYNIGEELSKNRDWGIIVLLRNPLGIMWSYKKAGIRKNDFRAADSVLPFCYDFLKSVKKIQNKKNVIIVKYENLCNSTDQTLHTICKFMGVSYQTSMQDFNHHPINKRDHILKGNRLIYDKQIISIKEDNDWQNNLTANEIKKIKLDKKLVNLYNYFGYKI